MESIELLGWSLNGSQYVIHWGWFQMTLANLVVIILMIAVLVGAIVVPFPKDKK